MSDSSWCSTHLETSGTPIDKLDCPLGSDIGHSRIDVFGDDVSSVQETTSHVFTLSWIAFDHLVVRLEARNGHLGYRVGLVES